LREDPFANVKVRPQHGQRTMDSFFGGGSGGKREPPHDSKRLKTDQADGVDGGQHEGKKAGQAPGDIVNMTLLTTRAFFKNLEDARKFGRGYKNGAPPVGQNIWGVRKGGKKPLPYQWEKGSKITAGKEAWQTVGGLTPDDINKGCGINVLSLGSRHMAMNAARNKYADFYEFWPPLPSDQGPSNRDFDKIVFFNKDTTNFSISLNVLHNNSLHGVNVMRTISKVKTGTVNTNTADTRARDTPVDAGVEDGMEVEGMEVEGMEMDLEAEAVFASLQVAVTATVPESGSSFFDPVISGCMRAMFVGDRVPPSLTTTRSVPLALEVQVRQIKKGIRDNCFCHDPNSDPVGYMATRGRCICPNNRGFLAQEYADAWRFLFRRIWKRAEPEGLRDEFAKGEEGQDLVCPACLALSCAIHCHHPVYGRRVWQVGTTKGTTSPVGGDGGAGRT
jgi:hypothetical protein